MPVQSAQKSRLIYINSAINDIIYQFFISISNSFLLFFYNLAIIHFSIFSFINSLIMSSFFFSLFVGSYECPNFISQFDWTVFHYHLYNSWLVCFVLFSTAPRYITTTKCYISLYCSSCPITRQFQSHHLLFLCFLCVFQISPWLLAKISIKWKMNSSTIVNFITTTFISK